MRLIYAFLVGSVAVLGAGAAYAQAQGNPARAAMEKACATDITSLCDGKAGREALQCLTAAGDKVSAGCKDTIAGAGAAGGAGFGARGAPGAGVPGAEGPAARGAPRAPPSQGGTVGPVDSVSPSGFVVTMSSGQKATVETAPSTTYRKGKGSSSASAITAGEPVLVLGIIEDIQGERKTVIKASQVIAQPPGITVAAPAEGTAPQRGVPAEKKSVGDVPANYVEGEGTIVVDVAEANKAILAALTAYPNGIINRVVKLSDGNYEAHHIGVSWPHHVFLNSKFKYIGAN
jgi:hypothetical protein